MDIVIQGENLIDQQLSDDASLLRKAQKGDAEAFGDLYERYANPVHRYLYVHLTDRMDAEDLTEEVFLRVWNRLAEYRDQGIPFIAFLLRVARNVLIDYYRTRGRLSTSSLEEESNSPVGQFDLGDQVSSTIEQREIRDLLKKLREDYRTVLAARFLSGLSPEETARVMGRSTGAVRVLQHRALEALRKLLIAERNYHGLENGPL